jgi:hypothetical protein
MAQTDGNSMAVAKCRCHSKEGARSLPNADQVNAVDAAPEDSGSDDDK